MLKARHRQVRELVLLGQRAAGPRDGGRAPYVKETHRRERPRPARAPLRPDGAEPSGSVTENIFSSAQGLTKAFKEKK
ncbi:hypothetical protein BRADI_2g39003v3 [Brachypodium distachyon]|uniref:Uncharacterized protein n=1 Tax=Brachypodium distachyon TaxID=15368 RepID=A0A0Q3R3F3_BRADI|nr:hypothetical protein BRADI_2g39003v3 [Brachypodium distachyon]